MEPRDRLILALDLSDAELALELADRTREHVGLVKVGLPLLLRAGLGVVDRLRRDGHQIFLDMKFHDIPSTVEIAVRESARWRVRLATLHALAGPKVLSRSIRTLSEMTVVPGEQPPRLLAVTVLTHMDPAELERIGLGRDPVAAARSLARMACEAGVDGLVASAHEVPALRETCGRDVIIVCPGIRLQGQEARDQSRTATAAEAIRLGADYLVVGRPIHMAADPVAAARAVVEEIAHAQAHR